jgi:hypothetical protein
VRRFSTDDNIFNTFVVANHNKIIVFLFLNNI